MDQLLEDTVGLHPETCKQIGKHKHRIISNTYIFAIL